MIIPAPLTECEQTALGTALPAVADALIAARHRLRQPMRIAVAGQITTYPVGLDEFCRTEVVDGGGQLFDALSAHPAARSRRSRTVGAVAPPGQPPGRRPGRRHG